MAEFKDQIWHRSDSLQDRLEDFHHKYAYFPYSKTEKAKSHYDAKMKEVHHYLIESNKVKDFIHTGSTVEGIRVPSACIEMDIMVVLPGGEHLIVFTDKEKPLYVALYPGPGEQSLQPSRVVEKFCSDLHLALNKYPEIKEVVNLRHHGPAVLMDVYTDKTKTELFYQLDMVPTYKVPSALYSSCHYYVPKSHKYEDDKTYPDTGIVVEKHSARIGSGSKYDYQSWRQSFSLQEKEIIGNIDKDGGCQKQCMRILKVLRDAEPPIHHISSYIIKTAMLRLAKERSDLDWDKMNLGERLMDLMQYLVKVLANNHLSHYFVPQVNLLEHLPDNLLSNMKDRLKRLTTKEYQFDKLLKRIENTTLSQERVPVIGESALNMQSTQRREPQSRYRAGLQNNSTSELIQQRLMQRAPRNQGMMQSHHSHEGRLVYRMPENPQSGNGSLNDSAFRYRATNHHDSDRHTRQTRRIANYHHYPKDHTQGPQSPSCCEFLVICFILLFVSFVCFLAFCQMHKLMGITQVI